MTEQDSKSREIARHNVFDHVEPKFLCAGESISMLEWAQEWLVDEVLGIQAHNTAVAKRRDLERFFKWFYETNQNLDIADWLPRDTAGFLAHLEDEGMSPATVNRALATLRRWARWSMDSGRSPFVSMPTKGIKARLMEEPDAKKLSTKEVNRLFKAADKLVLTDKHKSARPRRNRAILAVAYYTGLRVSEINGLRLSQFMDHHFNNVIRKGGGRNNSVYISKKCHELLDDYVQTERIQDSGDDPPLFDYSKNIFLPCRGGEKMSRNGIWLVIKKLSREASAHLDGPAMKIHPHQLRHTFGYEVRKRTGSDTETAALLGHAGLKYVGRYTRATDEERAKVLDDL